MRLLLTRRLLMLFAVVGAVLASLGPATTVQAANPEGLTMTATAMLDGHARIGSWMAIDVHVRNDGPPIVGELRLAGGVQGKTRFGTPVDLPTQSEKSYRLYAQPPAFGRELTIDLIEGDSTIASTKAAFSVHEAQQLIIGVVAERPGEIVGGLDLLPNQNAVAPLAMGLTVADLPDRVEAWNALDRLVWQDTDSATLSAEQLEAMRGWIAGGGRLIIVGGTSGPASLSAFSDEILPYRPDATTDVAAASLQGLLGELPDGAADLPALAGTLAGGRALATSGDRVIAAERAYGSGAVTIVGFDPTIDWLADSSAGEGLWRRLLPARSSGGPLVGDDSQIVSAASQLPTLALPPIGGLIALLGAYILLIGPVNYLVLRRLDRREWAWVTMPALIVIFAVASYGIGSFLRGSEVIVNEVAIVRGAPGATEGTAQSYLGVFSPSRGTYQIRIPGGALLSAPVSGDFFGGDANSANLDILQGDPARIRNLGVGFGSLRTVRAESAVSVPLVQADLQLIEGRLKGTVTNQSDMVLQSPAVVLGSTVQKLDDIAPGATSQVDVQLAPFQFGQQLSDKVVGPMMFGDPSELGADGARMYARRSIIDQLTFDPNFGFTGQLPSDGPVLLAWGDEGLLDVQIEGQTPRRTGNVLYFLPAELAVSGTTTFRSDLLRSTVVSSDAGFFSKDPFSMSFGRGNVELAYRPITVAGTLAATELILGMNTAEPGFEIPTEPIEPLPAIPLPCDEDPDSCPVGFDGLPEVELFDLTTSTWVRLPHFQGGERYAVVEPARYVDPATGTVLIRFVNEQEQTGFSFEMAISGEVE